MGDLKIIIPRDSNRLEVLVDGENIVGSLAVTKIELIPISGHDQDTTVRLTLLPEFVEFDNPHVQVLLQTAEHRIGDDDVGDE
jgi:hypothetical protein